MGRALTNYFLENNYSVIIGYHNDSNKYINNVEYIKCDVTNSESIENIIVRCKEKYGKIDIMINLSCICMDNSFLNKTKDEFMRELEVNLVGTFLCNQMYSRYIDNGLIINIASTDGIDTYNEYSMGYSVSKAGIICLSKIESMSSSSLVLCVSPNWVETSSTIGMNHEYLQAELSRIGQSRLITLDEFVRGIDQIINSDFESGDHFRIDIKGDCLWVGKM